MSIIDALERAKQMGLSRKAADRRIEALARPESSSKPARAKTTKATATQPSEPLQRVDYARVAYDPLVCAENHVIMPDVEANLASMAASPYRMLRTRILQRCRVNEWSCLAVTSPGAGEGKSVTALNLAISIAREGNNDVFLLDLDMRHPSAFRYLGASPNVEISRYLAGHAKPEQVLTTVGIDRLVIGGNETGTDNSSELLATGRLEELFLFISRVAANPLIIIDLPPVLATDDALVVAPKVDAFVLVVTEGKTRRDGLQRATDLLADFPVAGVVLNQSHESIGTHYYSTSVTVQPLEN